VKSADQFNRDGCENCPDFHAANKDTTPRFSGLFAMMQPNESWVAKWNRLEIRVRGMYALAVLGTVDDSDDADADVDADGDDELVADDDDVADSEGVDEAA